MTTTAMFPGTINAAQQAYISELLSYPLDRLSKEPDLLRSDAERISRQMQEAAVANYKAFITASEALQSISHEVECIDQHLKYMVEEIPDLTNGCNEFFNTSRQILDKRKLNRTLLANHSTLLDLLEIPQLMDTCVRNGNYDEALDLEAFVSKLATMHSRMPIIQFLIEDVRQTTHSLLAQLLQRLRSNIQLPECLRIIGYLRRLGVYGQQEMRLQFLVCREAWLVGILDELDGVSPYEHLKRMADCHRIHLFDVVSQYRAIFADDTSGQEENDDGGLLYSWAMHRITSQLETLRELLPKISEGGSLAIILEQCMYCGMSLGRVGLDFRGLLPPLFEDAASNLFSHNMSIAVENFQHALDVHRWLSLPSTRTISRLPTGEEASDDLAPPQSLMDHPPLAVFVNGVLAALNELRHCAPVNLRSSLAKEMQQSLQSVAECLLRYNATRMLKDNELILFLSMCKAYVEVACPYCILCFGRCYNGSSRLIQVEGLHGLRKLMSNLSFPGAGNIREGNSPR